METLEVGGQIDTDPADITTLNFSWDGHFESGVLLSGAGTFAVADETEPAVAVVALSVAAGPLDSTGLGVQFQMTGGTRGHIYQVSHHVTTAELLPQQRTRSFYVYVREL
jgi:hypothetical protein